LPGFADGDQQRELNQTLPNGGWQIGLTICSRKVEVVPPEKWVGAKRLYLFSFSTIPELNGEYLLNQT